MNSQHRTKLSFAELLLLRKKKYFSLFKCLVIVVGQCKKVNCFGTPHNDMCEVINPRLICKYTHSKVIVLNQNIRVLILLFFLLCFMFPSLVCSFFLHLSIIFPKGWGMGIYLSVSCSNTLFLSAGYKPYPLVNTCPNNTSASYNTLYIEIQLCTPDHCYPRLGIMTSRC